MDVTVEAADKPCVRLRYSGIENANVGEGVHGGGARLQPGQYGSHGEACDPRLAFTDFAYENGAQRREVMSGKRNGLTPILISISIELQVAKHLDVAIVPLFPVR